MTKTTLIAITAEEAANRAEYAQTKNRAAQAAKTRHRYWSKINGFNAETPAHIKDARQRSEKAARKARTEAQAAADEATIAANEIGSKEAHLDAARAQKAAARAHRAYLTTDSSGAGRTKTREAAQAAEAQAASHIEHASTL